ncbi:MAG: hypothetical protein JO189_25825 [Deltaproteobacteria bacterium]|nr:hypothetical protein [Deltaproteobacteria bacterium]
MFEVAHRSAPEIVPQASGDPGCSAGAQPGVAEAINWLALAVERSRDNRATFKL